MKKFLKVLIVIILLLVAILLLFRNFLVEKIAELAVNLNTNMAMDINEVQVGITRPVVDIIGLAVYSPQGFDHTAMMSVPEIFVEYDRSSLFPANPIHLREVRVHLEQVALIRNEYGKLNIASLKVAGKPIGPGSPKPAEPEQRLSTKPGELDIIIDTLSLKVDRLMYIDYFGRKDKPDVQTFNVNLNQTFTNITDLEALITTVSQMITKQSAVSGLGDALSKELGRYGSQAQKELEKSGNQAAEDIVNEGKKTLEDAAETLEELLPFRKK